MLNIENFNCFTLMDVKLQKLLIRPQATFFRKERKPDKGNKKWFKHIMSQNVTERIKIGCEKSNAKWFRKFYKAFNRSSNVLKIFSNLKAFMKTIKGFRPFQKCFDYFRNLNKSFKTFSEKSYKLYKVRKSVQKNQHIL